MNASLLPPSHCSLKNWRLNVDFFNGTIINREWDNAVQLTQRLTENNVPICLVDINRSKHNGNNDDILLNFISGKQNYYWVAGGVSSIERVNQLIEAGAKGVILSSAMYKNNDIDHTFLRSLMISSLAQKVILSVDFNDSQIRTYGFDGTVDLTWDYVLDTVYRIGPFQIQIVDVKASIYRKKPNLELLNKIRQKYSEKMFWYAGNIGSWNEAEVLSKIGFHPAVGQSYLRNELGLS
ncbi:HisA/HisF-related TIM barrel protein [Paenibacillus sp. GCM10012307]|uniref:5-proFAR isomerase n=1 Tax=Paenibacillus roseus TaxID=2798579 RepID=A0A934J589_9BACL|nr:HisA/HisF-related TIM barrel protein [Paenibacillus roseus]MBJ6360568.1 hypothetical protein [Paenibacillus roseus]